MPSRTWMRRLPRVNPKLVVVSLAALLALVVVAGVALWTRPILKVATVEVMGTSHLQPSEVHEASGISEGQNLVRIDEAAAATAVAQLEWVESVTVARSLPSTVSIRVTEHTPVLFTRQDGQPLLIDERGEAFTYADPPEGTMEATGEATNDPEVMRRLVEAVKEIDPGLRAQVASVSIPHQWETEFHLADGRVVYWGSLENATDKALAMRTVLTREGEHWDVSNPRLVTVR